MKVRNGLVSNSSTSSFILITTKEHYEKSMKDVHPYVKAVGEALKSVSKFLDKEILVFATHMGRGGEGTLDWITIDYDDEKPDTKYGEMTPYDAFEIIEEELGTDKNYVFTHDEDW